MPDLDLAESHGHVIAGIPLSETPIRWNDAAPARVPLQPHHPQQPIPG